MNRRRFLGAMAAAPATLTAGAPSLASSIGSLNAVLVPPSGFGYTAQASAHLYAETRTAQASAISSLDARVTCAEGIVGPGPSSIGDLTSRPSVALNGLPPYGMASVTTPPPQPRAVLVYSPPV